MTPIDFLKTIYLGDRALKGYSIDSWNQIVKLHISEISRVRSKDGQWNFYNDENLEDGRIVFEGVTSFLVVPSGAILDDYIEEEEIKPYDEKRYYVKFICGGMLKQNIVRASLEIIFEKIYLETANKKKKIFD